jgi:hypothetical protein
VAKTAIIAFRQNSFKQKNTLKSRGRICSSAKIARFCSTNGKSPVCSACAGLSSACLLESKDSGSQARDDLTFFRAAVEGSIHPKQQESPLPLHTPGACGFVARQVPTPVGLRRKSGREEPSLASAC